MKKGFSNFLKSLKYHWIKIFSIFFFVVLFASYAKIFAIFTPGQTLDPNCAPGATGCIVSGPWLTGSSNIYHNGNVNVGSDTASVNASISGASSFATSTLEILNTDSLDMIPSITLNNDGNPVIVYYTSPELMEYNFIHSAEASGSDSSLNIIVCTNPTCTTSTSHVIDNSVSVDSGYKPSVKIDSNNLAHIAYYEGGEGGIINYAVCNDEECSDPNVEGVTVVSMLGQDTYSLSLDANDNPYIIYSLIPEGRSSVLLARYTGTGTEDSCINSNWKCTTVASSLTDTYVLDHGGLGDFMFLNNSGYPRFITEHYDDGTGDTSISYHSCSDEDCTNPTVTDIDVLTYGSNTSSVLAVNNSGIPYIAYVDGNNAQNVDVAYYVGGGIGSGCSETDDWTCVTISTLGDGGNDWYWSIDMKIGSDGHPLISTVKYLDADYTYSLEYIKCLDEICSDANNYTIFSQDADYYETTSQIVLDDENQANFASIDGENEELKFTKETISSGTSFTPNGDDFFTFGDVGIKGNLFTDGKTVLVGGLYLSDNTPDDINNALYNDGGDLYWNGNYLLQEGDSVDYATTAGSILSDISYNTKIGTNAGINLIEGSQYNTFLGFEAGKLATSAIGNTSIGIWSLYSNTTGSYNTANGVQSLYFNTTGSDNTASGDYSLYSNVTGSNGVAIGYGSQMYVDDTLTPWENTNTSVGYESLRGSINPADNIWTQNSAFGYQSMMNNRGGLQNTASGAYSLSSNTDGIGNVANGAYSLNVNTTGSLNTAGGSFSLGTNLTGSNNVANGNNSLYSNHTGSNNVAIGNKSGQYIANGSTGNTTGDYNVFIGSETKALADNDQNEIVIGYNTIGYGSNTTTIGTGNVLYVGGSGVSGKVARFTNSAGYCDINPNTTSLTCSSDISLKKNITTLNKENIDFVLRQDIEVPESILGKINILTPVTYNWNTEEDTDSKHIGFIAQEVEQIFPDLVFTDEDRIDPVTGLGLKSIAYSNFIPYTIKAIQELDLKVKSFEDFEAEGNTFRDNLGAWLANAKNKITRIFTGEICLTDGSEEGPVCLNASELRELKKTLNTETNSDSNQSNDGQTPPIATCSDGIMNQDETDIDEGGVCNIPDPTCTDGILNQNETDIDTGGVCEIPADPSCSDGIMNQDETGIDEGGVCTPV